MTKPNLITFLFIVLLTNSISANPSYVIQKFDEVHIRIFGASELYYIDTLDENGCFSFIKDKLDFCFAGEEVLHAGNQMMEEILKFYRATDRSFYFTFFSKESNYSIGYEVWGGDIRNQLIPYSKLQGEFNLNSLCLKKGMIYRVYNLPFHSNNELSDQAKTQLQPLKDFLIKNDSIIIEVGVYFDERLEKVFIKRNSQPRAESIVSYLETSGIEKSRLIAKGYEDKYPLIRNAYTEAQHSKNRRVEFRIIKIE